MMKKIKPFLLVLFALLSHAMSGQETCDAVTIDVTDNVVIGADDQHAQTFLTANNTIETGATATYKAGTSITLNAGFEVELGAEFSASIEECDEHRPFIMEWDTVTHNDLSIIHTKGTGYDYTVKWGDNTSITNHTDATGSNASHTYINPGIYTIEISGDFPRIYFKDGLSNKDNQKIRKIIQWGDIEWTSMNGAFYNCYNLDIDPLINDIPDLSGVTDMTEMFWHCSDLTKDISNWVVKDITNMEEGGTAMDSSLYSLGLGKKCVGNDSRPVSSIVNAPLPGN